MTRLHSTLLGHCFADRGCSGGVVFGSLPEGGMITVTSLNRDPNKAAEISIAAKTRIECVPATRDLNIISNFCHLKS